MPAVSTKNGGKIILADTNELEIVFNLNDLQTVRRLAYVTVVSSAAGVQISSGETIDSTVTIFATGTKVPVSFINGSYNIRLKGTNGDVLSVTY